jgi:hypothetical protein
MLGYSASSRLVAALLHDMGYGLQGNRKTVEGNQHPDRNAQFEYINHQVESPLPPGPPSESAGPQDLLELHH